jgi:dTDP-4-amino-4,6-dideoxygalactose transaminase
MKKLAINGGPKQINREFIKYNSIGEEELAAATQVIRSGVLSDFVGEYGPGFLGGSKVNEFERYCENYFGVKHAITVNSWTSGLIAAVGAIGIEPGDEVITTPWTMCATATAILHWNALPVFADIDPNTFCICPKSIEANITSKTKAIIGVDLFGMPCDYDAIDRIADRHNLKVIYDSAQAPNAKYKNHYAGTRGDIGGISLNFHKHIHTGEGGVLFTNNYEYAQKLRLIRNHAEAVVGSLPNFPLGNMIGYNFRMGEIESAIGIEQLRKLQNKTDSRRHIARRLSTELENLPGLLVPKVPEDVEHVYYVYAMKIDSSIVSHSRKRIIDALEAEGVPGLGSTYGNVHLLPVFQNKIAYGSKGFPWSTFDDRGISYKKGICPIAEELSDNSYIDLAICSYEFLKEDIDQVIAAFTKVWNNFGELA